MNKKNFIFLLALSFTLLIYPSAFCSQRDSFIGMGLMYQQRPYTKVDSDIYPVPIISLEYKRFFIDQTIFGLHLIDMDKFKFSIISSPRLVGYDSDESSSLNGMEDRKNSLDGGLRVKWNNGLFTFTITGLTDLLGKHQGQEVNVFVSKEFFKKFIIPRMGLRWLNNNLVNYYYGIKDSEVTSFRPAYKPEDTINYFIGSTVAFPLSKHFTFVVDFQYEFLGEQIKDSPIVDKEGISRLILGIIHRF